MVRHMFLLRIKLFFFCPYYPLSPPLSCSRPLMYLSCTPRPVCITASAPAARHAMRQGGEQLGLCDYATAATHMSTTTTHTDTYCGRSWHEPIRAGDLHTDIAHLHRHSDVRVPPPLLLSPGIVSPWAWPRPVAFSVLNVVCVYVCMSRECNV